jgi:nitrite reductase/ring-hydroxylating ferredoxin subunit
MERQVRVASKADVEPDSVLMVDVDGIKIVLCRVGDHICAVQGLCTHRNRPLTKGAQGCLVAGAIQCVWDFAEFDPMTGTCLQGPHGSAKLVPPLRSYPLTEVGDELFIDLGAEKVA